MLSRWRETSWNLDRMGIVSFKSGISMGKKSLEHKYAVPGSRFIVCKTNANAWQIRHTRAPLKFVYDHGRIPLSVPSIDQFGAAGAPFAHLARQDNNPSSFKFPQLWRSNQDPALSHEAPGLCRRTDSK